MTRHDDGWFDAIAELPQVAPDVERSARLRDRCVKRLSRPSLMATLKGRTTSARRSIGTQKTASPVSAVASATTRL